ncbi:MAG TPA: hypothetical protein VHO95_08260 [Candidatus Dormibacteraeota bacterium]|nr:hypothetical protein [Candidatus Dormibacteraeota bacterium]
MRPRLTPLVALGALACGGRPSPAPAPQTPQQTLVAFMAAVKANDLDRMGQLWGGERGAAAGYMNKEYLHKSLTVFQIYLNHTAYRVVDGPLPVPGKDRLRTFRVELERPNGCSVVLPIDLVHGDGGTWLVNDVHLEAAGNPATPCKA